jgi:hypothetical protein
MPRILELIGGHRLNISSSSTPIVLDITVYHGTIHPEWRPAVANLSRMEICRPPSISHSIPAEVRPLPRGL